MRHLHYRRSDNYSLCGISMEVTREPSVHVSKARKSDCEDCRLSFRQDITAGRSRRRRSRSDGACATGTPGLPARGTDANTAPRNDGAPSESGATTIRLSVRPNDTSYSLSGVYSVEALDKALHDVVKRLALIHGWNRTQLLLRLNEILEES